MQDRVRNNTSKQTNRRIDEATKENVESYEEAGKAEIRQRLRELDSEWDIERTLELNASLLSLTGVILGTTINRKWLILTGVVTTFLLQHSLQGWCPPLPLFRRMGIRTQKEIEEEKKLLEELLTQ